MKKLLVAAAVGCALTAGALGASATAGATAKTNSTSVTQTVAGLQGRGYTVIVNSTGAIPLDMCTTYSVRPGQTYSRMDTGFPGAQDDIVTKVVSMTVYVDASC